MSRRDIDNLMRFEDAAAARAALASRWDDLSGWAGDVIEPVAVVYTDAVHGEPDPETGDTPLITPAVVADGHWMIVVTDGPDPDLLGREECRLATDRAAAAAGEPFGLVCREEAATIDAVLRIEPLFGGSSYPFGALVMIDEG